jgi:predicted transport protein
MPLGLVEEDEEVQAVTNRDYWLDHGSDTTVKMADEILELVNSIKPGFTLKYNKFYIGLAKNGQVNNFAICRPKKNYMRLEVKLPKTAETDALIESSGIEEMGYDNRWGNYRLRFSKGDIKKQEKVLLELLAKAETNYNG